MYLEEQLFSDNLLLRMRPYLLIHRRQEPNITNISHLDSLRSDRAPPPNGMRHLLLMDRAAYHKCCQE